MKAHLQAAELIAFDVLDPVLRSRVHATDEAKHLHADTDLHQEMKALLSGEPSGRLVFPTLAEAMEKISHLERRIADLGRRL